MMNRRSQRSGAQVVEFALTFPLVMMVLAGIVDASWYLHRSSAVIQATRDGARQGATWDWTSCASEATLSTVDSLVLLGFTTATSAHVTSTPVTVGTSKGVRVDVAFPHTNIFDYPFILPDTGLNYTATAVYRLQDQS